MSSATQHAMPPEFGGKWETEIPWFTLSSLVPSAYSVLCGVPHTQREAKKNLVIEYMPETLKNNLNSKHKSNSHISTIPPNSQYTTKNYYHQKTKIGQHILKI